MDCDNKSMNLVVVSGAGVDAGSVTLRLWKFMGDTLGMGTPASVAISARDGELTFRVSSLSEMGCVLSTVLVTNDSGLGRVLVSPSSV